LTHFVVVDIPALCLLFLTIILDSHTDKIITFIFISLWGLDVLSCWIIFTDDEEGIHASIDHERVYLLSTSRRLHLAFIEPHKFVQLSETDETARGKDSKNNLEMSSNGANITQVHNGDDTLSAFGQTNTGDAKSDYA
jgi:hypothetical protein